MNIIIENKEIKINELPLLIFLYPIKVLNSLWSADKILFHKIKCREGIIHMEVGINNNPKKVLVQFNERLPMLVDGSNTENKLVIIFN